MGPRDTADPPSPYPPLIVHATLAGGVERIVRDAWVSHQLGATVLHLRAGGNDRQGRGPNVHSGIIASLRERCPDAVICVRGCDPAVAEPDGPARPDVATLPLGSPESAESLAESMLAAGVKPGLEVGDSAAARAARGLLTAGLVREPLYADLVPGVDGAAPAAARRLFDLVEALPDGTIWVPAGTGASMLPLNAIAVFAGGHARTDPRLVERIAGLAGAAGRPLATPAQARGMLGLEARPGLGFRIRPARLPGDRDSMLRVLETVNMHRVPSPEMHDFDVGRWYVAEDGSGVIGVAGFRLLHEPDGIAGKTTLLAVYPEHREKGVGRALQELRLELMRDAGAIRAVTNADRPETIEWYKRHFGYRVVGRVAKEHEFGLPDVDHWTTLEARLS